MNGAPNPPPVARVSVRAMGLPKEVDELVLPDLSDEFGPFLPYFMRETLRAAGEVLLARVGPEVKGVYLHDPIERTASIFTRSVEVAAALYVLRDHVSVFSELPLGPPRERYDVFSLPLPGPTPTPPFRHPVRAALEEDRASLLDLMNGVYERFNAGWLGTSPNGSEKCFVVEAGGRMAGAAWVSRVGDRGRLHSLSVSPRYRRLGIGSDLWRARVLWAARVGVRHMISEIPEQNTASRAIARRGGMRPTGLTFRYDRP